VILAAQAEGNGLSVWEILVIIVYLMLIAYLGYLGWRRTKTASDYLIAGRQIHPWVMALSYGATFISTSAIVGFGGVAGLFGMSILWLVFLNIFAGIFIAFVFLGPRTRAMGHRLDAHTFPELLGRRFNSSFIRVLSGLIIFLFVPLYAAAVLTGGTAFIEAKFGIDFGVALLVLSVIVAAYVVVGGLKAVMYTDALQGGIMIVGMGVLLVMVYNDLGGVTAAHRSLSDLAPLVPEKLQGIGHRGWTSFPQFGWDADGHSADLWWIMVSTIILGVGIGVLAQPQLAVRFMTVKSNREFNRAVVLGGIFILLIPGTAYVTGSLSNAWFAHKGPVFEGVVLDTIDEDRGFVEFQRMAEQDGQWQPAGPPFRAVLDKEQPHTEEAVAYEDGMHTLSRARSIAIVNVGGQDQNIIPKFIGLTTRPWFSMLFLMILIAAALTTLSSQLHVMGTSLSRDVIATRGETSTILTTRLGVVIGIVLAVLLSYYSQQRPFAVNFIARATAIFFGLCVSTFLPAFVGGLYFKRMTKTPAIASMIVGFIVTAFWLTCVHAKTAGAVGLLPWLTDGKTSLLEGTWQVVDPLVIALPLSIITAIVVGLLTPAGVAETAPATAEVKA
jgi:SSS family solute:Na+ symporter